MAGFSFVHEDNATTNNLVLQRFVLIDVQILYNVKYLTTCQLQNVSA